MPNFIVLTCSVVSQESGLFHKVGWSRDRTRFNNLVASAFIFAEPSQTILYGFWFFGGQGGEEGKAGFPSEP